MARQSAPLFFGRSSVAGANLSIAPERQPSMQTLAVLDKAELRRKIDELLMRCGLQMVQETIK